MKKTAFERYAPYIREFIYKKKWNDLKEVQVEACEQILDTPNNLILASSTASGKTEAAFFPILTDLERNPSESVSVLYISPLKALINDQFKRLTEILDDQNIPIIPWHGDINYTVKQKAYKQTQGIIQITPESLEAMIMKNPAGVRKLFSDLRYIVVDEIHSLMNSDRGLQTVSLINRLERLIRKHPRRIGLSATLSNYSSAIDFLSSGSPRPTKVIGLNHKPGSFQVGIELFELTGNKKRDEYIIHDYSSFLYDLTTNKKSLIFTNSRNESERTVNRLKGIASQRKEPDIFYTHHGSLSNTVRKETEDALKNSVRPLVAAATVTLELGIDIGNLDRIVQIGAPYSCSSFVQRLGRSGRENGKSQMFFIDLYNKNNNNPILSLPWNMLRAISIIELYKKYRWIEPISLKTKPYSLLAHQTLSTLYTFNGLKPFQLAKQVLSLPPFSEITRDEYRILLNHMIEKEYLEQLDDGEIIIGIKAEGMVNHFSFFSVFESQETYEVIAENGSIGSLDECPPLGSVFILAGKSWKTVSVNEETKKVYVIPFKSNRLPERHGEFGVIHKRIVEKMKEILQGNQSFSYLQPRAQQILEQARKTAQGLNLFSGPFIKTGEFSLLIAPWLGTKEINTLYQMLDNGLKEELKISYLNNLNLFIEVVTQLPVDKFIKKIQSLDLNPNDMNLVLPEDKVPQLDKYDFMIPEELLRKAYLENQMNMESAISFLKNGYPEEFIPEYIGIDYIE